MEPYHHHPLDPTCNEIRLFTLAPGSDPQVTIEIVHLSLDETPHYEALSYAWGDPTITEHIIICEPRSQFKEVVQYKLKITVNLAAALRQLRENAADDGVATHEEKPVFWADAICINQRDDRERGHQVRLMSRIYKQCSRVCIWLGAAFDGSDKVMDMAMEFVSKMKALPDTASLSEAASDAFISAGNTHEQTILDSINSLVPFVRRPWFRRLWILQEVLLARSAVVLCGSKSMVWEFFWRFLYLGFNSIFLHEKSIVGYLSENFDKKDANERAKLDYGADLLETMSEAFVSSIFPLASLNALQTRIKEHGTVSLRAILSLVAGREFTDGRDSIYALLSLAAGTEDWDVTYTVSQLQVFSYATSRMIQYDASLDIICHAGSCLHHSPNPRSWLPRFNYEAPHCGCALMFTDSLTIPGRIARYKTGAEKIFSTYNASKSTMVDFVINDDNGELQTCGSILDSVEFVAEKPTWKRFGRKVRIYIPDQWIKIALATVAERGVESTRKVSETTDLNFDEFWRTLVAGRATVEGQYRVAPKQWGMSFKAWIDALGTGFVAPLDLDSLPECLEQYKELLQEFSIRIQTVLHDRKTLIRTAGGRLGLARWVSITGDLVCILKGCSVPMIIRPWPNPDSKKYVLIGEAYIHGIMDGEMVDEINAGKFHWEEITIV